MELAEKLLEIRKTVVSLNKGSRNEHFKFDYVSSNQVLSAVRLEMDKHKLLLLPSIEKTHMTLQGNKIITELWLVYSWHDIEADKSFFSCNWYAQGVDSGEKGVGKALTYAEKYFLLKFFNIATDADDPDASGDRLSGVSVSTSSSAETIKPSLQQQVSDFIKQHDDVSTLDTKAFLVQKGMLKEDEHFAELSNEHCHAILDPANNFIDKVKAFKEI